MTLEVTAMLNRLLLGAGLAVALAACASTPPQPTQTAAAKAPVGCVPDTGYAHSVERPEDLRRLRPQLEPGGHQSHRQAIRVARCACWIRA